MPVTSEVNLELLIKLLKLSNSPNDSEALLAARKANEQIGKVGGDWDTLLRGKVTIIANPFSSNGSGPIPTVDTGSSRQFTPIRAGPPPRPAPPPRVRPPKPSYMAPGAWFDDILWKWVDVIPAPSTRSRPPRSTPFPPITQPQGPIPVAGQSAIINFAAASNIIPNAPRGSWLLRSDEQLKEFSSISVQKRKGGVENLVCGKFVKTDQGFHYYEIFKPGGPNPP